MVMMNRRVFFGLLMGAMIVAGVIYASRGVKVTETRQMMGTQIAVTIIAKQQTQATKIISGVFDEIARMEKIYSDRLKASELGLINRDAYAQPVTVSEEMGRTIDHAFYWYERSGKKFDITVGVLGTLWGTKGTPSPVIPTQKKIEQTLTRLGMDKIDWEHDTRTIRLRHPDMQLDLGGIAKLEILQSLALYFKSIKQHKYLVNLGGDVLAGQRGELVKWKIGISNPKNPETIITRVELEDSLVLTSGDYFRQYELAGEQIHHIFDPVTGEPFRAVNAVSLVMPANYPDPMPSVVAFLLGKHKALEMIEALPMVEGLVYSEGQLHRSTGFQRLEVE